MLLANCCAGNMLKDNGIFRIHNTPSIAKIDELTLNLAQIGIVVKQNAEDGIHKFILSIQERAKEVNLEEEVNRLIIKAQKQAVYDSKNIGHFGLGFEVYSHFTSPIRRYSDLILHRLLKNISTQDIDSIAKQVSLLERETDKVAKDYEARVYARWAEKNLNKIFSGNVIDNENKTIIELKSNGCKIKIDTYLNLFEDIQIKIISSNLFTTEILGIISDDI
jgi:ribonuclease R